MNKLIGGLIAKQFLFFLTPNLNPKTISKLAFSYGKAIKYADNLSDLNEDLARGYLNIPKEKLRECRLSLIIKNHKSIVIKGDLKGYKRLEIYKIELMFEEANRLMKLIISRSKNKKERNALYLFKDVATSWLEQARDLCD